VWETRVTVATDPISGRAIQRSFMWHGGRDEAEVRCAELAVDYAVHRVVNQAAPFVTVDELLERWLASDHDWRPSTWPSYRSNTRAPRADSIAGVRVARLDPLTVRTSIGQWRRRGVTDSVLSGRFRTLAAAPGWAHQQRLIDCNPRDGMRGPPQPAPCLHAPVDDVVRLLRHAEQLVDNRRADADGGAAGGAACAPGRADSAARSRGTALVAERSDSCGAGDCRAGRNAPRAGVRARVRQWTPNDVVGYAVVSGRPTVRDVAVPATPAVALAWTRRSRLRTHPDSVVGLIR
jgi:hypothetical protein